jgi:sugar phosphate isomerase/epimerase
MRLGGFFSAESEAALQALCPKLDTHGLSAVPAPEGLPMMSLAECEAYGAKARDLGLVIGEYGMWENLLTADRELQSERIGKVRHLLKRADAMGCRCVVTVVGSMHPSSDHPLTPHRSNHSVACRSAFHEVVLRILDGLDLQTTRYVVEPWHHTFFYQPKDIRSFFDQVDHPSLGLHLDLMNMVDQNNYFDTTSLMHETFDLLSEVVVSVHLKDLLCDHAYMFLKWDEVLIGDGVLDYETYLRLLSELPRDTPCYCEHLQTEAEYALNFARLHYLAKRIGVEFLPRVSPQAGPAAGQQKAASRGSDS